MTSLEYTKEPNRTRGLPLRTALAGLVLSIVSADAAGFSGVGHRIGIWDFRGALGVLRYSGYAAIIAGALSMAGLYLALKKGAKDRKKGAALGSAGVIISAVLIAVLLYWYLKAVNLPRIHDITTDTAAPPEFTEVLKYRKDAVNSAEYAGAEAAELQKRAYPDIIPLGLDIDREKAFEAAFRAAKEMRWDILYSDSAEGRIEATDETFWFGFKDDIIVRVAAGGRGGRGRGSVVDVRSASRVGVSDVGKNAGRIREYLKKVRENALTPQARMKGAA